MYRSTQRPRRLRRRRSPSPSPPSPAHPRAQKTAKTAPSARRDARELRVQMLATSYVVRNVNDTIVIGGAGSSGLRVHAAQLDRQS